MSDEIILRAVGELLSDLVKTVPKDSMPEVNELQARVDQLANRADELSKTGQQTYTAVCRLEEKVDGIVIPDLDTAQISDGILKQVSDMIPPRVPDYGDDIAELKAVVPAVEQLAENFKALDSANNDLLALTGERLADVDMAYSQLVQRVDGIATTVTSQLADVLLVKAWYPGIHREGTRVTHNMGDQFIALKDTSTEPDIGHADWALVTRGQRYRGVFVEGFEYSDGDIVAKDGASWLYAQGRLRLQAMRGEKGSRGEPGPRGQPGANGMDLPQINAAITKALDDVDLRTVDIAGETAEAMVKALMTPPDTTSVPIKFFRGEWAGNTSYGRGDAVMYAGHLYLAEAESNGSTPRHGDGLWFALTKAASYGPANIIAARIDDLNNTPHLSEWTGTQAEYDALGTWDPSTFYTITDAPAPLSNAMLRTALETTSTFAQFKAAMLAAL